MITGLGHLAFRIADLERSLDFYCGKLGLHEAFRMNDDKGDPWIVYIRLNADNFIELFPGGKGVFKPPSGAVGYAHVCLRVDDMEATLKELTTRGVEITGKVTKGRSGCWQYWLTDPDGNRIELMEILPNSLQATSS